MPRTVATRALFRAVIEPSARVVFGSLREAVTDRAVSARLGSKAGGMALVVLELRLLLVALGALVYGDLADRFAFDLVAVAAFDLARLEVLVMPSNVLRGVPARGNVDATSRLLRIVATFARASHEGRQSECAHEESRMKSLSGQGGPMIAVHGRGA